MRVMRDNNWVLLQNMNVMRYFMTSDAGRSLALRLGTHQLDFVLVGDGCHASFDVFGRYIGDGP